MRRFANCLCARFSLTRKDPGEDITLRPKGLSIMFGDHSGGPWADALSQLHSYTLSLPLTLCVVARVKEMEPRKSFECHL